MKAQGFHTSPELPTRLASVRWAYYCEDGRGKSTRLPTMAVARATAQKTLGRAVARYYEPWNDTWQTHEEWCHPSFKGLREPLKPYVREMQEAPTSAPQHKAPTIPLVASAELLQSGSTCYRQTARDIAPQRPPAPTIAQSKPKPKAVIQQPGVGYYLATPSGNRITKWMFTTFSATAAYATQIGMEI